jgi:hypothetical protein
VISVVGVVGPISPEVPKFLMSALLKSSVFLSSSPSNTAVISRPDIREYK